MTQILFLVPICLVTCLVAGVLHLADLEDLPWYTVYNTLYLLAVAACLMGLIYLVTPA